MPVLIPGLPDLPALRQLITDTLKPVGLLGTYLLPNGETDDAIAVEGIRYENPEEAYPPSGTQVEGGLEVVITPATDLPMQPLLDGYNQTFRHAITLKQRNDGQNQTLQGFQLLQRKLGNIFVGSVIRQLPNPRLESVEQLSFLLEQIVYVPDDDLFSPPLVDVVIGSNTLTTPYTAASALIAPRVITLEAGQWVYASAANSDHANRLLALLMQPVGTGESTTAIAAGLAISLEWSWSGDALFLGLDGALVEVVPIEAAFERQVATVVAETEIFFNPEEPRQAATGGNSYEITFTDGSLSTAGLLPVVHNLGSYPSGVAVFNSGGEIIYPDQIEILTVNTLSIDLANFRPLEGTWRLSVTA